jgi:phospholipid N-methyltransferase
VTSNSPNVNVVEPEMTTSALEARAARPADGFLFFKKFLAKGRTISSAVPSSSTMVGALLRYVDFTRPGTIIELGAGTGPVTEQILERLQPFHRFVAVENDHDFCEILRRRFPQANLLEMDASRIGEPLRNLGIHKVDYVISGLPTPNLPAPVAVRLWRWLLEALTPHGLFVQLTIAPLVYRAFYERLFATVEYDMVWRNIPPGGIYLCSNPRRHLYKRPRG